MRRKNDWKMKRMKSWMKMKRKNGWSSKKMKRKVV
jgi:hypothetical protein